MEENPQWSDVIYKMLQLTQCSMAENDFSGEEPDKDGHTHLFYYVLLKVLAKILGSQKAIVVSQREGTSKTFSIADSTVSVGEHIKSCRERLLGPMSESPILQEASSIFRINSISTHEQTKPQSKKKFLH